MGFLHVGRQGRYQIHFSLNASFFNNLTFERTAFSRERKRARESKKELLSSKTYGPVSSNFCTPHGVNRSRFLLFCLWRVSWMGRTLPKQTVSFPHLRGPGLQTDGKQEALGCLKEREFLQNSQASPANSSTLGPSMQTEPPARKTGPRGRTGIQLNKQGPRWEWSS